MSDMLNYGFQNPNIGGNNNSALGELPGMWNNDYKHSSTFLPQLNSNATSGFSPGDGTDWSAYMQDLGVANTGMNTVNNAAGGGMLDFSSLFGGNASGFLQGAGEAAQGIGSILNYFRGGDQIEEGKRQFGVNQEFAERQYADSKSRYDEEYGYKKRARARFGIT